MKTATLVVVIFAATMAPSLAREMVIVRRSPACLQQQDLSEFALHARAILGLPIPEIRTWGPAASCAVLAHGHGVPKFSGVERALAEPGTMLRLFGKPRVEGHRRVAVTLARGTDIEDARARARRACEALDIELQQEPSK